MFDVQKKQFIAFILNVFLVLATSSCTKQIWYESLKLGAENICRKQPPSESERCQESLNKKNYEEYKEDCTRTNL
jgi:hypothetical protein